MDMVGPRPEKRHLQNKGFECLFRQIDMGEPGTGRATHYPTCDVSTTRMWGSGCRRHFRTPAQARSEKLFLGI